MVNNMVYQSIKWTIISLLIILLCHYLYSFLQGTLTVPKGRYINNNKKFNNTNQYNKCKINNNNKNEVNITQEERETNIMKHELSDYLLKIKKKIKKNTADTEIINDTQSNISDDPINTHNDNDDNDDSDDSDESDLNNSENDEDISANDIGVDSYTLY